MPFSSYPYSENTAIDDYTLLMYSAYVQKMCSNLLKLKGLTGRSQLPLRQLRYVESHGKKAI